MIYAHTTWKVLHFLILGQTGLVEFSTLPASLREIGLKWPRCGIICVLSQPLVWQFVNYAIVLIPLALRIKAHKDGFKNNGDKNCRLEKLRRNL